MDATIQTGLDKVAKQLNEFTTPLPNVFFTPRGWGSFRQILGWIHGLSEAAADTADDKVAVYAEKLAHDLFWTLENLARDPESRLVVAYDGGLGGDWRDFSFTLWQKTKESKPEHEWTYDESKQTLETYVTSASLVGNQYGGSKVWDKIDVQSGSDKVYHFVAWMNGGIIYRGSRTTDPMSVLIGQNSRLWTTHT